MNNYLAAFLVVATLAPAEVTTSTSLGKGGGFLGLKGVITGVVYEREREDGQKSLLIGLDAQSGGFDGFNFKLDPKLGYDIGYVPPEWGVTRDGRTVTAQGPSTDGIKLRLDFTTGFSGRDKLVTRLGGRLEVEAFSEGRPVFKEKLSITELPKIEVKYDLEGILDIPYKVSPGDPFLATANESYSAGNWFAGVPPGKGHELKFQPGPPKIAPDDSPIPRDRVRDPYTFNLDPGFFRDLDFGMGMGDLPSGTLGGYVPGGVGIGEPLRFGYFDQWGELLVDAKPDQLEVVPPSQDHACDPLITGNAPRVFEGNTICICVCASDPSAWFSMNLDGRPIGAPAAASRFTVLVRIPEGTNPGPHEITWGESVGSASGKAQFRVLTVEGSIDANRLKRLESTTMHLRVLGTEEKMPLEITNKTPSIIDLEGGVPATDAKGNQITRQVIETAGGADNKIERNVKGISVGGFEIVYKLDESPCPCPSDADETGASLKPTVAEEVTTTSETPVIDQPRPQVDPTSETPIIDRPQPRVCDSVKGRVPEDVIKQALANPARVPGFVEATNLGRLVLSLRSAGLPYHPLYNPLVLKSECP